MDPLVTDSATSGVTTFASLDELRSAVGSSLGASRSIEVSQQRIQQFADATEDQQWIHVDIERAASGPFGGTIAHGYLTLSFIATFLGDLLRVDGISMMVNYGMDRVRFPAPVPVGSVVSATGVVRSFEDRPGGAQATVEMTVTAEGSRKPACVAEVIVRFQL